MKSHMGNSTIQPDANCSFFLCLHCKTIASYINAISLVLNMRFSKQYECLLIFCFPLALRLFPFNTSQRTRIALTGARVTLLNSVHVIYLFTCSLGFMLCKTQSTELNCTAHNFVPIEFRHVKALKFNTGECLLCYSKLASAKR